MMVNLYTDGACKEIGPGGWGVVIIKNGNPVDEIYGGKIPQIIEWSYCSNPRFKSDRGSRYG